jgi:glycosyltransferase involved in cell wall biosynthesis
MTDDLKVTLSVNGKFHLFHLARQLEKRGLLSKIHSGYPLFKLRDEKGIPREKINSFPWFQASYMVALRYGLTRVPWLLREWEWYSKLALDFHVAAQLSKKTILIGLSGSGLRSGRRAKSLGGFYICDRGSSHITYQNRILHEEYNRWGLKFHGVDPRVIDRERQEYEAADLITVPSQFCLDSFDSEGVDPAKLRKIPYGARLERFQKYSDPDKKSFRVLWVGAVSIRKAFLDALHAFHELKHPHKEFLVIGSMDDSVRELLRNENLEKVQFNGTVPNQDLPKIYSSSHVFVLPSVEEGLAMVMGEAMACGCPVIASENTGARDFYEDGKEGFIVPIRTPERIAERLHELAENPEKREQMSHASMKKVSALGGWDTYGETYTSLLREFNQSCESEKVL